MGQNLFRFVVTSANAAAKEASQMGVTGLELHLNCVVLTATVYPQVNVSAYLITVDCSFVHLGHVVPYANAPLLNTNLSKASVELTLLKLAME